MVLYFYLQASRVFRSNYSELILIKKVIFLTICLRSEKGN